MSTCCWTGPYQSCVRMLCEHLRPISKCGWILNSMNHEANADAVHVPSNTIQIVPGDFQCFSSSSPTSTVHQALYSVQTSCFISYKDLPLSSSSLQGNSHYHNKKHRFKLPTVNLRSALTRGTVGKPQSRTHRRTSEGARRQEHNPEKSTASQRQVGSRSQIARKVGHDRSLDDNIARGL